MAVVRRAIGQAVDREGTLRLSFGGCLKIDQAAMERGRAAGRPRVKIVDVQEMLEVG